MNINSSTNRTEKVLLMKECTPTIETYWGIRQTTTSTRHTCKPPRKTHAELDEVGSQQHAQTLNQVTNSVDECRPHVDVPGIVFDFVVRSFLTEMATPLISSLGVAMPSSVGVAMSKDSAHAKEKSDKFEHCLSASDPDQDSTHSQDIDKDADAGCDQHDVGINVIVPANDPKYGLINQHSCHQPYDQD